jgi:hypothetical protein
VALAGCGKKAAPAPTVAEQADQSPAAAAASPAPVAAAQESAPAVVRAKKQVSPEDQLQGTVHPEMTMRLQMFLQMKGRLPESFYELQNMGGFDSTPGLPPAFKYEIDPKDKTVKIVRK